MKFLFTTLVLTIGLNAFAQTIEEAKDLFAKRGEDVENAKKAAKMYVKLAEKAEAKLDQTKLYNDAALSFYYVGTQMKDAGKKMEFFNEGIGAAILATEAIEDTAATHEEKEQLAISYYRYGSNLGKWAEANGVASSLSKWKNLKNTMEYIISMGFEAIEAYGPSRILGRAYYKLPSPLGSKSKSRYYLSQAFDNTLKGDISVNGLNNLFYADLLIATGEADVAKKILTSFVAVDATTFNLERIPETKQEIEEAKTKLKDL